MISQIVIELVCNDCICGEDNDEYLGLANSVQDCARLCQKKSKSVTFQLWDSGSCGRCSISKDPTLMMVSSNPVSVYRVTSGKIAKLVYLVKIPKAFLSMNKLCKYNQDILLN